MPKIIQLEQHVADLIAAGEVVERPSSVVKELIENSIDSGAGIITVEISSGGMTYIRITDNGCGIAPGDAKTAFFRHATSKLHNAEGLEAIDTLGFRGEALAAIAAVSRVELMTREVNSAEGISLTLEAGEVIDMSPVGCPEGTTIIVRDLFFNTPARLKFMKSDRAEASSIASVVLRAALSRPDVSIRFIRDGKTEYHTPGDSRIDSCVYSLLGREIEAGFLSAESSDENIAVEGYVSSPVSARGNRSYQFFFVNGRVIRSILLQTALEQAYKNTLPSGRFPSCVLFITTKTSNVDVNVHPAKTEVKFISDKQVFDGVYYAALGALNKGQTINDKGQIGDRLKRQESMAGSQWLSEGGSSGKQKVESGSSRGMWKVESRKLGDGESNNGFRTMQADEFRGSYVSEPQKAFNFPLSACEASEASRIIGEALNVYIIIEKDNSVWFIDKHAAHERILFDSLKSGNYTPMSESLLTPVICRLGHEDAVVLLENAGFLESLGFSVESFGEDSVAVRHIPADIDIGDTESVLSDLCPQLRRSGVAETAGRDSIYKTIACKAAIKAGKSSEKRELETLVDRVMSGEISQCPHGRPVAFELKKNVLDKGFGRV
ncbi:MAG: DNA mismatch repair endonuclease MutL [Oscillospiraceae bacterium]|nr:DNA mismatch repair endonuclease MutL [Oscillospiraceae bacterium]